MTLYELKILMHYHVSPTDYKDDAPIRDEVLKELLNKNLLEEAILPKVDYRISSRGRFYINYIENLPLPETTFYIPGA